MANTARLTRIRVDFDPDTNTLTYSATKRDNATGVETPLDPFISTGGPKAPNAIAAFFFDQDEEIDLA